MKILIIITLVAFFSSCKIHRQRHTDQKEEYSLQRQWEFRQQEIRLSLLDSSKRHWSFWTDGWLYYHPDSGLIAQGGQLQLQESRHQEHIAASNQTQQSDSIRMNKRRHKDEVIITKRVTEIYFWLYVGTGLILLYLLYRLYRYLKIQFPHPK
ncbi:MAG: hypothetical protein LBE37_06165 [Sphingobacterium sp.]|jgi:hypothetical protein|nr:hypothetical protein [Sphingobacterium sp.]